MPLSKSNLIIIAVALIVIIGLVAYFESRPAAVPAPAATTATNTGAPATPQSQTEAPVPADVIVPSQGQVVASSVAVPEVVAPANAHTTDDYRSFSIQADDNQFTPSTIVVNQEDVVNISMTAVDKSYDFTQPDYGLRETIPKGQTKTIQFGATATGKFTFYCSSCGGPSKGPIGYIIVAPK
jgi:heme/copper-type cytochrome/quinol oxidase subunit 2